MTPTTLRPHCFISSRVTNRAKTDASVWLVVSSTFFAHGVFVRPAKFGFVLPGFMFRQVFGSGCYLKIFKSVVELVSVYVMHNLRPYKHSPNVLFHQPAMKIDDTPPVWKADSKVSAFIQPWFWHPLSYCFAFVATFANAIFCLALRAMSIHCSMLPHGGAT